MKDEIIKYDTAVLAKEKGFDCECNNVYNKSLQKETLEYYEGDGTGFIKNSEVQNTSTGFIYLCTAPTQSLLQRWLREVYKINIIITFCDDDTWEAILQTDNFPERKSDKNTSEFNIYEDCLEYALKEALLLL